jgi:ornithine cyclodeaminase/alanine dehydrogenase
MLQTLLLSKQEVESLLKIEDCIDSVEEAYKLYSQGKTEIPGILHLAVPQFEGEVHIKAGYVEFENPIISLKMGGGYFKNQEKFGIPSINSLILLYDARNGYPISVMDGSIITKYRTGAAGAIAVKHLANVETKNMSIIGCGTQGRAQLECISKVTSIKVAKIYDHDQGCMRKFEYEMASKTNIKIIKSLSLEDAIRDSDIIVTATPSRKFYVLDKWIRDGVLIVAVGTDSPGKQELDPNIFKRAKIVVDNKAQCKEVGEIQHAIQSGLIKETDIYAEIGDIVSGKIKGRISKEEIIVFDTTGMAIQDAAAANVVFIKAKEQNKGQMLKLC